MFRALPEVNRICSKAARDRAYEQHLAALRNMKASVNTRKPQTPQSIGRNYKRYENEKQRCSTVLKDNQRLEGKMHDIQKQEHFPRVLPQRPYTLQGQAQKDEMARIDYENKKLLKAIETRKPTLNRTEWTRHRLDHTYQITKMSEFKKSVPMSDIVREEYRSSMSRPHTTMSKWGSQTSPSKADSQAAKSDDYEQDDQMQNEEIDNNEDEPKKTQQEVEKEMEENGEFSLKGQVNESLERAEEEKKEEETKQDKVEKEMDQNGEFSLTGQVNESLERGQEEKKAQEKKEAEEKAKQMEEQRKKEEEENKKKQQVQQEMEKNNEFSLKGQVNESVIRGQEEKKEAEEKAKQSEELRKKEEAEKKKQQQVQQEMEKKNEFSLRGQVDESLQRAAEEKKQEEAKEQKVEQEMNKNNEFSLTGQVNEALARGQEEKKAEEAKTGSPKKSGGFSLSGSLSNALK